MDKTSNPDQGSSSAGESPAGALESQQPRTESMGDDGSFFVGRFEKKTFNDFIRIRFIFSLPAEVVRRVNALRNLQYEHHKIEASFFEEVHALECRYLTKYQTLYDKVRQRISKREDEKKTKSRFYFDILAFEYRQRILRTN